MTYSTTIRDFLKDQPFVKVEEAQSGSAYLWVCDIAEGYELDNQNVRVKDWDQKTFDYCLIAMRNMRGNTRAVLFCEDTDPYQMLRNLTDRRQLQRNLRLALRGILEKSKLRVVIRTSSPLVEGDFGLLKEFGGRLHLVLVRHDAIDPVIFRRIFKRANEIGLKVGMA